MGVLSWSESLSSSHSEPLMGFTNFELEVEAAFFSPAAAQLLALALVAGEVVFFLFFLKHIPGMCRSVDDYYVLFRQISIDHYKV